jgi:Glycine rich protein/Bacterial Ig-like domain (group 2)/Secretion system C-terminal sorting domain
MKNMYKFLAVFFVTLLGWSGGLHAQITYNFSYTGGVQSWTVPPGVTSVDVVAKGASGGLNGQTFPGGSMADSPGHGGCVTATLAVTPGTVLNIYVAGGGTNATTTVPGVGGYNGGGNGNLGYVPYCGGGGGGGSDIRIPPYALANRVVVAGGGAGAGGDYFLPPVNYEQGGDGGGTIGKDGKWGNVLSHAYAGKGGTGGTGGAPGSYPGWCTGVPGTLGVGSNACSPGGGGGGGGGYYGGGGGAWGGGGGGSSWTDPVLATAVVHTQGCNVSRYGFVSITVNCTPPVGGVVLGVDSICVGQTTTYTDPTGTSGGTWSSSNPAVATIVPATGLITGVAPGVVTITYSIVLSCGSASATKTITINPLPANIVGPAQICVGSTINYTDAFVGGIWSSSNPAAATIGSANGVVNALGIGVTTLTYTLPTGCSKSMVVNVQGISGSDHVCAGDQTTLTAVGAGPQTWFTPDTAFARVDTAGVVTGLSMGLVHISYTFASGCTTVWLMTVNPMAPIVGRDSVCTGSFRYLTDIVGGGVWSSSIPSIATVTSDSGRVTGHMTGITTITYTLPGGCIASTPFTVIDYPAPITGDMKACPGTSTTLSDVTPGGTWTTGDASVATVDAFGNVTGVFADTVDIYYTIQPGCPVYTRVKINPLPDPIIGNDKVCPGNKDTMTDATPYGIWTSNPLAIATIDTYGVMSAWTGGIAYVRYSIPATGCYIIKPVTVNPIPVPAITYDWNLNTFFATPGYLTYQWYDSVQGMIHGATSPNVAAVFTGYYYVMVTDSNGCIGTSPYYHYHEEWVGVKNTISGANIRIFPNPTSGIVYIESPVKVRAVITTIEGKVEMERADAKEMDITRLADGLYLISLYDDNGVRIAVQKLTKL